jgi:hypothetical protein
MLKSQYWTNTGSNSKHRYGAPSITVVPAWLRITEMVKYM